MFQVTIYQPTKTAMQSGRKKSERWKVEYSKRSGAGIDPLMGWHTQEDTLQQLNLFFDTKEDAISYAERNGLNYKVIEPKKRIIKPKNYASNFDYNQVRKTS